MTRVRHVFLYSLLFVSPSYAGEIQTGELGSIVNGILQTTSCLEVYAAFSAVGELTVGVRPLDSIAPEAIALTMVAHVLLKGYELGAGISFDEALERNLTFCKANPQEPYADAFR